MNWEIYNLALAYMLTLCIVGGLIGNKSIVFLLNRLLKGMYSLHPLIALIISAIMSFFVIKFPFENTTLGLYLINLLGTAGLCVAIFVILIFMRGLTTFYFFPNKVSLFYQLKKTIPFLLIILVASYLLGGAIDLVNLMSWLYILTVLFVAKFYGHMT